MNEKMDRVSELLLKQRCGQAHSWKTSHTRGYPGTQGIRWEFWPGEYVYNRQVRERVQGQLGPKEVNEMSRMRQKRFSCKLWSWILIDSKFLRVDSTLEMVQATKGPRIQCSPNGEEWGCQVPSYFLSLEMATADLPGPSLTFDK